MDLAVQAVAAHGDDPLRDGVEVTLVLPSWLTRVARCSGFLVKREDGDVVHGDEDSDPGSRNPRLLVHENSVDGCIL